MQMKAGSRILSAMVALLGTSSFAQSNIDATDKYAWGENIGWTNWRDANGSSDGVIVGTDFLEGFIWGENIGWINVGDGTPANTFSYANVNGTDFGVNIDADDDLSGFAWGENVGWINFGWGAAANLANRARFDFVAGRFRGYAWGENIGWINLDDAARFVAASVGVPIPCNTNADCVLFDDSPNGVCTCDLCVANECTSTPIEFGNVNCSVNQTPNLDDILCVLAGFAMFANCPNADVAPPCSGNDIINIDDILQILGAFAGSDPCGCMP
jgi:hypothetical protein